MSNIISLEVVKNAAKDNTSASLSRHAIAELAKYIAALEAENAELKAQLAQAETARNTWFDAYNQRGVTIDRLNEELEESIGDAAEALTK